MTRHRYTDEEKRFIEENITGRRYAEMVALFNQKFGRPITKNQLIVFLRWYGLKNMRKRSNNCPVGSELKCGEYTLLKTAPNVWKKKHILIWEAANGPLPKGHVVIFADQDTSNYDLDNLLLISKRELLVMNRRGLIFADAERTKTGKDIADVYLAIYDRTKKRLKKEA